MHQRKLFLLIFLLVTVYDISNKTEQPKTKKYPHKWWQGGDRFEDRVHDQDAEPQAEHQIAFKGRCDIGVTAIGLFGRDHFKSSQDITANRKWHDHIDDRCQENSLHDDRDGDLTADPENGGGDVTGG